jgi:hypothetical protein
LAHNHDAQAPCRFVLGFATLRDLVGAQKVGTCLEDEHFNLENGNSEQHTTGGLLVWRKADNFTAFTDGGTSWVNGPNGLQSRLNSARFSWERDPVQSVPTPSTSEVPPASVKPSPTTAPPQPGAPRSPRPTPTPSPIVATVPSSKLTPELAAQCTNLGFEFTGRPLGAGNGAVAADAARSTSDLCRVIVEQYGQAGFDCLAPAVREAIHSAPTLGRGNGGLAADAMKARLDLCLSTLTP